MIKRDSLSLFSFMPLIVVMLWQGSSCNTTKANKNATRNDNHSMNNNNPRQSSDVKGTWGGTGIAMEVTDTGAEISYDCANSTITEKIAPDAQGNFVAHGRYVREHGGPIREGEDSSGQPATYRGSIKGDTMSLTVTVANSDQTIGPFTLTRGKSGRIRKCL